MQYLHARKINSYLYKTRLNDLISFKKKKKKKKKKR